MTRSCTDLKATAWLGLTTVYTFMNCLEVVFERLVKFCFWIVLRTDYWGSTLWFSRRAAHWRLQSLSLIFLLSKCAILGLTNCAISECLLCNFGLSTVYFFDCPTVVFSGMCLWRRCWYMHSHLDSSIDDDSGMFHLTVVKQWQWCGMHTIFSIQ